jgi:hypothetical protein
MIRNHRRTQASGCVLCADLRAQNNLFHVEEGAVVKIADRFKKLPIQDETSTIDGFALQRRPKRVRK